MLDLGAGMTDVSLLYEKARMSRSFSRILHRKMLEKGWRNSDLVRKMNDLRSNETRPINRQIITSYTSGRSTPPLVTALLIAQALECDLGDLLSNTDNFSAKQKNTSDSIKIDDFNHINCTVRLRVDVELPISICSDVVEILRRYININSSGFAAEVNVKSEQSIGDSSKNISDS